MTETTFYKLTRHDAGDADEGTKYPAPVLAERPTIGELIIRAVFHIGGHRRIGKAHDADLAAFNLDATPEDLPLTAKVERYTYVIEPVGEMTHDERLTISVGRDTAKEARDALAWFQLGQQHPVTLDVEEDCLHVYLDDGSFSIGVNPSVGAEVFFKPTGEEPYEFGAVLPAGLGLDEEEQVEFYEIIDGLMGNLAGFHYLSGGAAVRAIVAEGRP